MRKRRTAHQFLMWASIGLINSLIGVLFVGIFAAIPSESPVVAASIPATTHASTAQVVDLSPQLPAPKSGIPVRVTVPSVGIDLSVLVGSYDETTQVWTLNDTNAFYADRTVPVNDTNGSTLVYGHATSAVFGRIPELVDGATATVYTNNHLEFQYQFASSRQVVPTDTTIFSSNGSPQLVLQTCSGPFDAYRTFVTFRLVGVESYD